MTTFREKRRTRKVASDEAHAWARSLQLGNPNAKSVLRALALYVDGEACCFVGIEQLAEDSDLSADTVRRRLVWLEEIGAIARTPQWLDASGRRNGDGKGKRTSDLIRLLLHADEAAIEARAAGHSVAEKTAISTAISPSSRQGLNCSENSVSPSVALGQPSQSCEGLISEPEPESPPLPPSGGEGDIDQVGESEPEHFAPAWSGYPGHEAMRRDLALMEFRSLPAEKQKLCRAAVPLFAAKLRQIGRTKPMNFHIWVRTLGFEEFPDAMLAEERPPPPERRLMQGAELDGFTVATRIAERREPILVEDQALGKGVWTRRTAERDLIAMAAFVGARRETWLIVEEGSEQFAAWRNRLQLWLGCEIKTERIWLEPFDPNVHGLSAIHPNFKLRKSKNGFRVPAPWPPRRDGSWSDDGGETA